MRTKRVNRYYCDFCKKSGCSASHLKRHEDHCTMNPDRTCGLCKTTTTKQLAEAVASIPEVGQFKQTDGEWYSIPAEQVATVLQDLEERLDSCPVCMFAALRQAGWAGIVRDRFDLKQRISEHWTEENDKWERMYGHG